MASLLRLLVLCFVLFGSINAQVPSYVPTNGLVGWWGFNGNANDASGNGNNGTILGGANLSVDRYANVNSCYEIDGVNCPNPKGINLPAATNNNSNYTISIWYKSSNKSKKYQCIINSSPHQYLGASFNYLSSNTIALFAGNGIWWPSLTDSLIVDNLENWNHLTIVKNGLNFYCFNNALLLETIPFTNTFNTGNITSFVVGAISINGGPNCYETFSGKLDDIGIWNRALTQAEITSLYQSVIPVTATASTISNVSCFNGNNGSATVSPNGGIPPYSYSWNSSPIQTTQTATGLRAGVYTVTVTDSRGTMTTSNATITQPNALTNVLASTISNVGCFGGNNGSATVTNPTGGTPPYTYQWNTNPLQVTQTANNLLAGTYMVTVTDTKGCTATSSVTIIQPAQPLSNIIGQTIQHVKCNGSTTGSVTVSNPIGGTPPYTYKWNSVPEQKTQIATNLSAGTYSVTVTDFNGCTATSFATVNEPTKVTNVQASVVKNLSCYGLSDGSAKVSDPRGGTPPYSYSWNTIPAQQTQIATNMKAGDYTVTVTDSKGCIAQAAVTITQPDSPVEIGQASVEQHVSCHGLSDGIINISAPFGGTPPYTIVWNTQPVRYGERLEGVEAGAYTAVVIDSKGCISETTTTVTEPEKIRILSPKDTIVLIQSNAMFYAKSNNEGTTYQWQTNLGIGFQDIQEIYQYTGTKTPILNIANCSFYNHNQPFRCILKTNGCYDTTEIATLSIRTNVSVEDVSNNTRLSISPNPTGESDQFLVRFAEIPNQDISIELLDILGSIHYSNTIQAGSESCSIPVLGLSSGMYMLRVRMNNEVFIEKVIVN